jgi:hypothetical protein
MVCKYIKKPQDSLGDKKNYPEEKALTLEMKDK